MLMAYSLFPAALDSNTQETAVVEAKSVMQRSSPALYQPASPIAKSKNSVRFDPESDADKAPCMLTSTTSAPDSGYSHGPLSAGQRRAHWRYFTANSHPQSNCDNNLSQTDNAGRAILCRHSSYPLSAQHPMTCVNIESPDDNSEHISSTQNYCPNNNLNTNNNNNNNIYTRGVPFTSECEYRRHTSNHRQFTPDAIVHPEGDEEEGEEDDDRLADAEIKDTGKPSTLLSPTQDNMAASVLSPVSMEEGNSHRGSTSGLSSSSSSGSMLDPHMLKLSPSSDLASRHQESSQLSEEPTSQSYSLYETAESLPDDSDSGLDPFYVNLDLQSSPPAPRSNNCLTGTNNHHQQLPPPLLHSPVQQPSPLSALDGSTQVSGGTSG